MNKAASISSLLLLWVLAAGCQSQGTQAQIHLRVFEVPTHVLQQHASDQNSRKLWNSAYSVSVVSPNELQAMLRSTGATQHLLAERTRVINDWPAIPDTWVYSPNYAGMAQGDICAGDGVGSVGVREHFGNLEVRLDYLVSHRGTQGERLIESKLFYDRAYPEGQVLLFHTAADGSAESPQQHIIAFEITRENQTPGPEVLAYR